MKAPMVAKRRGGMSGGEAGDTDALRWPRRWPVAVISMPAAVATWSGWVGLGEMTGFGKVKLLPGIWDSLQVNTAVTLPVGVEAYAAYALSAALTSAPVTGPTRRFAWVSSVCALALGMGAQVAYHLLRNSQRSAAPWQITTFVSCLPVLVLGLGAVLAHMLHRDRTAAAAPVVTGPATDAASEAPVTSLPETNLSHPDQATATPVGAGSAAPADLAEAVISARLAGRSERDVADAFGISRYRVKKILDARAPAAESGTVAESGNAPAELVGALATE